MGSNEEFQKRMEYLDTCHDSWKIVIDSYDKLLRNLKSMLVDDIETTSKIKEMLKELSAKKTALDDLYDDNFEMLKRGSALENTMPLTVKWDDQLMKVLRKAIHPAAPAPSASQLHGSNPHPGCNTPPVQLDASQHLNDQHGMQSNGIQHFINQQPSKTTAMTSVPNSIPPQVNQAVENLNTFNNIAGTNIPTLPSAVIGQRINTEQSLQLQFPVNLNNVDNDLNDFETFDQVATGTIQPQSAANAINDGKSMPLKFIFTDLFPVYVDNNLSSDELDDFDTFGHITTSNNDDGTDSNNSNNFCLSFFEIIFTSCCARYHSRD